MQLHPAFLKQSPKQGSGYSATLKQIFMRFCLKHDCNLLTLFLLWAPDNYIKCGLHIRILEEILQTTKYNLIPFFKIDILV